MRKLFILFLLILITANTANAIGINHSKYYDKGLIYSASTFPNSTAKNGLDNEIPACEDLRLLKKGESSSNNILSIVETGDASIAAAARNGNITKIYYVDHKVDKVYIPFLFIPIYVKEKKTLVYGE